MEGRKLGNNGEVVAIDYLQKNGIKILHTNYTIKGGEIDIVGQEDDILVFVEVKFRSSDKYGIPELALTKNKKRLLLKTIYSFCTTKKADITKIRADFISIIGKEGDYKIIHHRNIELY